MNVTIGDIILVAFSGGTVMTIAVKLLDVWLSKGKIDIDAQKSLRDELRADVARLTTRCDGLAAQIDEWQKKYYDLQAKNTALESRVNVLETMKADLENDNARMKREIATLRAKLATMQTEMDDPETLLRGKKR
jgi:chromosome segregation ATPase